MKIKFIKDYAINRGACPLDIGGFDMLETEIIKAGTVVDLEEDNEDGALNDELVDWLVRNAFAVWLEMTTDDEAFCLSVESCVSIVDDGFVPATNVKFPKEHQEQRDKFTEFMEAVNTVSKDEGFMLQTTRGDGVVDSDVATVIEKHGRLQVWKVDYVYRRAGAFYFDTCEHAYSSITKHRSAWQTILNYDWSRE